MKIFYGKIRKRLCALLLVMTVFVSAVYQNEVYAENISLGDIASLPDSRQAQTLEVKVDGHSLNGKHEYEEKEIADYKDGILMTLNEETAVLENETFTGDVYKNEDRKSVV